MAQDNGALKLDLNELKSGGFIKQTQENLFTVRLRCPGGRLTTDKLRKAAEIADKYGQGEVHNSVRQSIEIPYVHYKYFDEIVKELKKVDWAVASCGPRIRVPTACAGCTYNPNGIMDAQGMCFEVDKRYFGTATGHHKFKVTFGGCPIDCVHARSADLGFNGMIEPKLLEDKCTACTLCVTTCADKALKMEDRLPVRDMSKCTNCGDCIKVCPASAMVESRRGWLVRAGGKHGKHPINSYEVVQFASNDACYPIIEKTMEWYQANAKGRERLGSVFGRLGLDKYMDEVIRPLGLETIESAAERNKYYISGNMYQ